MLSFFKEPVVLSTVKRKTFGVTLTREHCSTGLSKPGVTGTYAICIEIIRTVKFNQRLAYCCKLKKNRDRFIFAKFLSCVISRKYHSRELATFLQFADAGKSCSSCDFTSQKCRENI